MCISKPRWTLWAINSLTLMLKLGRPLPTGPGYMALVELELREFFMKKCHHPTATAVGIVEGVASL